jgi:hypothetical protein
MRKINVTQIKKVTNRTLWSNDDTENSVVLIVVWENIRNDLADNRSLLNYVVAHREARTNVSIYDGRDVCTDP